MNMEKIDMQIWEKPQITEYDENEVLGKVKVAAKFDPENQIFTLPGPITYTS